MPCEFKLSAWGAGNEFTISSTGYTHNISYVRFFFSVDKGTGTKTIIKSTSTSSSFEIPQNTSIQV